MNSREALIALNMLDHLGPVRLRQLLDRFDGDPVAILSAGRERLLAVPGIGPETANSIANGLEVGALDRELKRIEAAGCHVLIGSDPLYPPLLKEIYDPPVVLYVKGALTAEDRGGIAVVGSRLTTHYGIEVARRMSYQLAYAGVTVVSGGARGIDASAHAGAMSAKGRTIAVLGSGIDIVFPAEHRDLFERIASTGAVITQFPFGRTPDKQTFPIRNRIVAGMTMGTLVVEANATSGAMITANFAADYGRQVYAVPGRIDSPRSKGCHDLIRKGARLCEGVEDILSEFEYLFPPIPERPGAGNPVRTAEPTGSEATLLAALDVDGELSLEEVIEATGLPAATVSVGLFSLEMKKRVRQLSGKRFVRADRARA
jgi:DNA processing protein